MRSILILSILFILSLHGSRAQTILQGEEVLQAQVTTQNEAIYLIRKILPWDSARFPNARGIVSTLFIRSFSAAGTLRPDIVLDTISGEGSGFSYDGTSPLFKGLIGGMHSIHIHFMDSRRGFIYGNFWGYGPIPYMMKTVDGGRSWVSVVKLPMTAYMEKENFAMTRHGKGFILLPQHWEMNANKIGCYISSNEGDTWTFKQVQLKQPGYSIESCSIQSSPNGVITITVILANIKNRELKKTVIVQSADCGESFRVYR